MVIRVYLDFEDRDDLEEFFDKLEDIFPDDDLALYLIRPDEGRASETYIVRGDGVRPDDERLEF